VVVVVVGVVVEVEVTVKSEVQVGVGMTLEECHRWLYRHAAGVSYDRDEEGNDILTVVVTLRSPDGEVARARRKVLSQADAVEGFIEFVSLMSESLNYE